MANTICGFPIAWVRPALGGAALVLAALQSPALAAEPVPAAIAPPSPAGPSDGDGRTTVSRERLVQAFAGAVDAESMARAAAGAHWAILTEADRSRFVTLFRRHLAALIGGMLPQQAEAIKAARMERLPDGELLLHATMLSDSGDAVPVAVRLRGEADDLRIVDVALAGISVVALKRAEIDALADREGMDAVMAKLDRLSTGAPELPAPLAPASAAPAPAGPAPAAEPRRQVVYFALGSAQALPQAIGPARQVAEAAAGPAPAIVTVTGYADPSGPAGYNDSLSRRRAEAVAKALVAAGVPEWKIRVEARGENPPAAAIAAPERRRVEIAVLPAAERP